VILIWFLRNANCLKKKKKGTQVVHKGIRVCDESLMLELPGKKKAGETNKQTKQEKISTFY
jgi:hypothetical protein